MLKVVCTEPLQVLVLASLVSAFNFPKAPRHLLDGRVEAEKWSLIGKKGKELKKYCSTHRKRERKEGDE